MQFTEASAASALRQRDGRTHTHLGKKETCLTLVPTSDSSVVTKQKQCRSCASNVDTLPPDASERSWWSRMVRLTTVSDCIHHEFRVQESRGEIGHRKLWRLLDRVPFNVPGVQMAPMTSPEGHRHESLGVSSGSDSVDGPTRKIAC